MKVKVYYHEKNSEGALKRAVEQVISMLLDNEKVEIVKTPEDAHVILAQESLRNIEEDYRKDALFGIIATRALHADLPENVRNISVAKALANIFELIEEASKRFSDDGEKEMVGDVDEEEIPLAENPLRILVVDDNPLHRASAKKLLAGHYLTVVEGYESAMKMLRKTVFEVLLTDLYLPMSSRTLGDDTFKLGELVPYGLLLMLEAGLRGIHWVAVVTDLNHHKDPISAAFDHFGQFTHQIRGCRQNRFLK